MPPGPPSGRLAPSKPQGKQRQGAPPPPGAGGGQGYSPPLSEDSEAPVNVASYLLFLSESIHSSSTSKWVKLFVQAQDDVLILAAKDDGDEDQTYSLSSCVLHKLSKEQVRAGGRG